MNRWLTLTLALLFAAGAGLLLRWPSTGQRPMHNDEAVNGIKFLQLWHGGGYRYDPDEHHGPTLYYFTEALTRASGAPATERISETRLRLVTVLFGIGLILLLPLFHDALGKDAILWAAIFTAVSPAFVFYSQYFIHEMLLVFFAAASIGAGWRYWRSRKLYWICLAGAAFGLMAATKETFVLSIGAAAAAALFCQLWSRFLDATEAPAKARHLPWQHVAAGCGVAIFTATLLFTSFGQNWHGIVDAIKTYEPWLQRAGGDSPHIHPWHFYWHRLLWFGAGSGPVWTEVLILVLALVAGAAGFIRRDFGDGKSSFVRFLTVYSVVLAIVYSVIPYKTPWCLLQFWHGFVLLAGVGAAWLLRRTGSTLKRALVVIALTAGIVHLGAQSRRAVGAYSSDRGNPYVYAQTLPNAVKLVDRIKAVASAGAGKDTVIKTVAPDSDYWPLPWYLAEYRNCGWWEDLPKDPYAPIMVISSKLDARLDDAKTHLMTGYYELRPGVFLELYVELELWKSYLAADKVSGTK